MEKNLDLEIGFKGQLKLNAQAVPMQEGYLKLGGIIDKSQTKPVPFGVVVSSDTGSPHVFKPGKASSGVIRGICVFDDAIAQNAPAHPDGYLPGFPAAVISNGLCWITKWGKTAASAIDPVIGAKVIFKDATGEIEFLASIGSAPSGWAELAGAEVKDVDDTHGALVYLK